MVQCIEHAALLIRCSELLHRDQRMLEFPESIPLYEADAPLFRYPALRITHRGRI
jgi:hypothetical protein